MKDIIKEDSLKIIAIPSANCEHVVPRCNHDPGGIISRFNSVLSPFSFI